MEARFISPEMLGLAGQTVKQFGYDSTGTVDYRFNQLGFRSPALVDQPSVIAIGNSVTFGIGLAESSTFGFQTARALDMPYANFSVGCYYHENHDHLANIEQLLERQYDDVFIIQINNLDRRRTEQRVVDGNDATWCVSRFLDYFEQINSLLRNRRKCFVYWDNIDYNIPTTIEKQLLIYNKFHLDSSLADKPHTFGTISHRAVARAIESTLT